MAFKKKNKTGGQVEEGREGGIERARKRQSTFLRSLALPTCHSALLPDCQHASLQTQLQVTKSSHCPTQGVPSMFHIINFTKMPTAYKEGNYILIRATNSAPLPIAHNLALRPVGSPQNNMTTQ